MAVTDFVPASRPWESPDVVTLADVIEMLTDRPSWQRDAACLEYTTATSWFPARGEDVAFAKSVCAKCLVRSECLSFALAQPAEISGIWGGTGPRERRRLRRDRYGSELST